MRLSIGSKTDTGLIRPHNEDNLLVKEPLFVVADGMGGHEAGEVASEIAVQTLLEKAPTSADIATLKAAVEEANTAIIDAANSGIGKLGMGTTITAAIIDGETLLIAQVGDSRAYMKTDMGLSQLTRDHSLMADMIDSKQISPEEARVHPNRSIITRALGSADDTQPDIYELTIQAGNRLLLCTDGLSGMLDDKEISMFLAMLSDPQEAANALVEAANEAGGQDNITVIVVDVLDGDVAAGATSGAANKAGKARRGRGAGAKIAKAAQETQTGTPAQTKNARRKFSIIAFIAALIILVGGASLGFYLFAQNQAYLILEGEPPAQELVLYHGFHDGINWLDKSKAVDTSSLDQTLISRFSEQGMQYPSLNEAENAFENFPANIQGGTPEQ